MRVRTHVNPLSYTARLEKIDYFARLRKNNFLDFEIGCGRGFFLKRYAQKYKNRNIIGVEIRKPVAEQLKKEIFLEKIDNAYVVHARAEFCLEDTIDDESLDKIFIFHPDPWLKRQHFKRRLINEEFIEILYKKLKKNGQIYVSSDVENLWNYMKNIIEKSEKFQLARDKNSSLFWQEDYLTNWSDFSKKDNRIEFYGTFSKLTKN